MTNLSFAAGMGIGVALGASIVGYLGWRTRSIMRASFAADYAKLRYEISELEKSMQVTPITTEEDLLNYIDIEELKNGIAP